jgi:type IV pilus assembly protein PilA
MGELMINSLYRLRKSQRAFTLVELLIVVGIIAILAAIAIPQFNTYRKRGYDASANADLRNIKTIEEALYADFTDYGASDSISHPGISFTTGAEVGPGGLVWLSGGRTSSIPLFFSLSPTVHAAVKVFFNGKSNTAYNIVTAHELGDLFYGNDSDSTALYRKGVPTTGFTAGMALSNCPAATFGVDDFAALGTIWTPIQ